MADKPVPRADEVPPAGVTPTVAADIEADAAGQPRPRVESLPPPGTERPTFWQQGGVLVALAATLSLVQYVTRPVLVPLIGDGGVALLEIAEWAWAAVWGIHRADTDVLRWK